MTSAAPSTRINWRLVSLAIVAACILLFVGANTHLVYVAFTSQPECVPHAKAPDKSGSGVFRAADSAC